MRNKHSFLSEIHKENKRARFLESIDDKTCVRFASIARTELLKAEARCLIPSLPKDGDYTFIPNSFLEKLIKQNLTSEQLREVLEIFRHGGRA